MKASSFLLVILGVLLVACNRIVIPGPRLASPAPSSSWQTYTQAEGLPSNSITSLAVDTAGGVWAGTTRGAAYYDGSTWKSYTTGQGLLSDLVLAVAVDPQGTAWFGGDTGITRFDGQVWTQYTAGEDLPKGYVTVVSVDRARKVWFGISGAGSDWAFGNGAARLDDGGTPEKDADSWQVFAPTRERMGGDVVSAILDAGEGGILFGTTPEGTVRSESGRGGLWRLEGAATIDTVDDRWSVLRSEDGLLNNTISALALDPAGALWVGTPLGLTRVTFDETYTAFSSTRSYFKAHGLPGNRILSLAAGGDGRIWVGTDSGLAVIDGDRIDTITVKDGLPGNGIRSIVVAPEGAVWVATPAGIGVLR